MIGKGKKWINFSAQAADIPSPACTETFDLCKQT